jgi:hypothetical protein
MPSPVVQLWNLETQQPEAVPAERIPEALTSGRYREFEGSSVNVQHGIGGEHAVSPRELGAHIAGGGIETGSEAELGAAQRDEAQRKTFRGGGQAVLAGIDGAIEGLSGGLMEGLPASGILGKEARELRGRENSTAKLVGNLAAIAATVVAPESALRFTPLGAANKAAEAVSAGGRVAKGGSVISRAIAEAKGGAAAGAILGSTSQVGHALSGRPVSGDALVDDIGIGAIAGFGLGVVGGAFERQAAKIANSRKEIEAAARFDEAVPATRGAMGDALKTWEAAHIDADRRMVMLNDLAKTGDLDASLTGREWLGPRREALAEAQAAKKRLLKVAKAKDADGVNSRIAKLLDSNQGHEVEKIALALDDYGTKVAKYHESMLPTREDYLHLLEVQGDTAHFDMDNFDAPAINVEQHPYHVYTKMLEGGASEHELASFAAAHGLAETPEQALGRVKRAARTKGRDTYEEFTRMIKEGRPDAELRAFAREHDLGELSSQQLSEATDDIKTAAQKIAKGTPREDVGTVASKAKEVVKEEGIEASQRLAEPTKDLKIASLNLTKEHKFTLGEAGTSSPEAAMAGRAPKSSTVAPQDLFNLRGKQAIKAHQILNEVRYLTNPHGPGELGEKLRGIVQKLESDTGGRLGTAEARMLAKKLGANADAISSPLAQRLVDMWAMKQMAKAIGDETSKVGRVLRKGGMARKALQAGAVTGARSAVRKAAGPVAGGMAGSLVGNFMGAALGGMGTILSTMGRMRNHAVMGLGRVLRPAGRRALMLTSVRPTHISYDGSEPTSDFDTKAKQLRQMVAARDMLQLRAEQAFDEIRSVHPTAALAGAESFVRRMENLEKRLPPGTYRGQFLPPGPPSAQDLDDFHMYEAVTHDPGMVFEYLKVGAMPESVIDAMREQHPDRLNEIREYVMSNPEEVSAAPYQSKVALSKLLGVPLVPEADALYIQRQQLRYQELREKAAQAQASQTQASMMRGGMPSPLPMTPAQQFATLPSIR